MSTVEKIFRESREQGRGTLVGYLPAGYPTVEGSVELLGALVAVPLHLARLVDRRQTGRRR